MKRAFSSAADLFCTICFGILVSFSSACVKPQGNFPINPWQVPVTGAQVPSLSAYDTALIAYMQKHSIGGATLAVMRHGTLVLSHGYGYSDIAKQILVTPTTRMRIASVTKPITAAIVQKLIAQGGVLTASTAAVPYLGVQPYNGTLGDANLNSITIQNLLDHKSGWDDTAAPAGSGFDPMFQNAQIASTLGLPNPVGPTDIIRYMLAQPLQHVPGSTYAYSNFGYCFLGKIIEKYTGQSFLATANSMIFAPLGITDVSEGASLAANRLPNEIQNYQDLNYTTSSVFDPSQTVPWPYGGFYLEAMTAHGAIVTSASSLVTFAQNYEFDGTARTSDSYNATFFGSLPGNFAMLRWRTDGVNIAVLFNQREDASAQGAFPYADIQTLLDGVTNQIANWP